MEKVRLYKVVVTKAYSAWECGEGVSPNPWRGNSDYYEGYSADLGVYALPIGYRVIDAGGHKMIVDDDSWRVFVGQDDKGIYITPSTMPYRVIYLDKVGE